MLRIVLISFYPQAKSQQLLITLGTSLYQLVPTLRRRYPISSHVLPHFKKHPAATKLLQSCPTLCDPRDGSPPGSPVPGIFQARTLEWAAISFSNAWKWKVKGKSLSRVRLFVTPWTAAYQAPPSMGFSRQEWLNISKIKFWKIQRLTFRNPWSSNGLLREKYTSHP